MKCLSPLGSPPSQEGSMPPRLLLPGGAGRVSKRLTMRAADLGQQRRVHFFRGGLVANDANPLLEITEPFIKLCGGRRERSANDFQHIPELLARDPELVGGFERLQAAL